ncbi:MAG: hypothetical protein R2854_00095 [Caldilineaceae bacterium]
MLDDAVAALKQHFDSEDGGFGTQPASTHDARLRYVPVRLHRRRADCRHGRVDPLQDGQWRHL